MEFYPIYFFVDSPIPLDGVGYIQQAFNETDADFVLLQASDLEADPKKASAVKGDKKTNSALPAAKSTVSHFACSTFWIFLVSFLSAETRQGRWQNR